MMRARCKPGRAALGVGLAMLAGCGAGSGGQCVEGFCLPADVVIVGREQAAGATLYQLAWRGERIGLYAGDQPDFDIKAAAPYPLPLDPAARLIADGEMAQVRLRLGEGSPRFLHLSGPCEEIATCAPGELARAITRERP